MLPCKSFHQLARLKNGGVEMGSKPLNRLQKSTFQRVRWSGLSLAQKD
jgi:hypothetical protein